MQKKLRDRNEIYVLMTAAKRQVCDSASVTRLSSFFAIELSIMTQ
jgi:hypothetical protein